MLWRGRQKDTRGDHCQRDLRYPSPMVSCLFFLRAKGEISKTCAHCPLAACEKKNNRHDRLCDTGLLIDVVVTEMKEG